MKHFLALVSLCITSPIWYYLLYKILVAVNGTELMFFLFWVYVPLGLVVGYLTRITAKN